MPAYGKVFPKPHTFLAVIHVLNTDQAILNARLARDHGANGVFLIDHGARSPQRLWEISHAVQFACSEFWVGLNFLGISPTDAILKLPTNISGLWHDNAGIDEAEDFPAYEASATWRARKARRDWKGLYFGGVAFKGQEPVQNLGTVARAAVPYMDVVTTSGDATGKAPSIEKIQMMRLAIGTSPLAIASGMTPENVGPYLEYANCFLVATGIGKSFHQLDAKRVKAFARAIGN